MLRSCDGVSGLLNPADKYHYALSQNPNSSTGEKGIKKVREVSPAEQPAIRDSSHTQLYPYQPTVLPGPGPLEYPAQPFIYPMSYGPGHTQRPIIPRGVSLGIDNLSPHHPVRRQRQHDTTMSINGDFDTHADGMRLSPVARGRPRRTPPASPMIITTDPFARSSHSSIPLDAAARQLYSTVDHAITFFTGFYRTFRIATQDIRTHANKTLLNSIWQSKIRSSTADPSLIFTENADNSMPMYSFREHQRQVLHRLDQLLNSTPPVLPAAAAMMDTPQHIGHGHGHDQPEYHDTDLYVNQQRHHAATSLKRKMEVSFEDVKYALDGMGGDYELAKLAIRELKYIKQHLTTMRKCWDKRWSYEASDGGDSDVEVPYQGEEGQQ